MDNLSAFLLQLPLMLILFAVAMALAAHLNSRRLTTDYGNTQAENRQLRGQTATYESTVTALQLENKTLTDRSTSSADQNRALAQQVRQLSDENTDLRYNRDVAYRRLEEAEAEFVRRYLERQRLRWFALLADADNRCHSAARLAPASFTPCSAFLATAKRPLAPTSPSKPSTLFTAYLKSSIVAHPGACLFSRL
jgi:hypothetical protein